MEDRMNSKKKIGVLSGGGDCAGLNAVIRAVVKTAILRYGWEVIGSEDSFDGLIKPGKLRPLTLDQVRGILPKGGTILGTTNRGNPFRYPVKDEEGKITFHDYSKKVIDRVRQLGLHALITIGGDGTLTIAQEFYEAGVPVIGVPKTIDRDLMGTEFTFGFDTALQTATEAIDKIHTTAESHDRVMLVEVMGRNTGWIALESGMAGGADVILIPEIPYHIDRICEKLQARVRSGHNFSVVVVAEGSRPVGGSQVFQESSAFQRRLGGVSLNIAEQIEEHSGLEARVIILGHLQRGGSPTPFDRLLGTTFGVAAVEMADQGRFGCMAALSCGEIRPIPISEAIVQERVINPLGQRVRAARSIGISLGD